MGKGSRGSLQSTQKSHWHIEEPRLPNRTRTSGVVEGHTAQAQPSQLSLRSATASDLGTIPPQTAQAEGKAHPLS